MSKNIFTRGLTQRITNPLINRRIVLANPFENLGAIQVPFLRGVYSVGMDFYMPGGWEAPGGNQWPVEDSIDYHLITKAQNGNRLGFRWEYLQPTLMGDFDEDFAAGLDDQINKVISRGGYVILDLHNYGRRWVSGVEQRIGESGGIVTQAHIVNFWTRVAQRWGNQARIVFGLMNEPHGYSDPTVYVAWVNACLTAIRDVGARNKIYVNGLDWNFRQWGIGSANRTHMLDIIDPLDNFDFDIHVYFDTFSSGTTVLVTADWDEDLFALTTWARNNGLHLFCGEWGSFHDPSSLAAATLLLAHFEDNKDVWTGYINLGGGGWWTEDAIFRIDPQYQQFTWSGTRYDFPVMAIMQTYLPGATTFNGDSTPNAFSFTDVTNAELSTEYESNEITIAGINQRTYIAISGGEYSINEDTYRSDTWSVKNGDGVKLKVTSSAVGLTAVNVMPTIGGISDTYTVTTEEGIVYESETVALVTAMTSPPDDTRKGLIDTLIVDLKSAGVWSKLDALWVMAAHDAQAARLNWKAPASFALSAVNSPTFTADSGYAGNGTTSYLNTGFTPTTHGVGYTATDAHMMVWNATALSGGGTYDIGCVNTSTSQYAAILGNGGSSFKQGWLNALIGSSIFTATTTTGMQLLSGHSGGQVFYTNGASIATTANAMSIAPNSPVFIGAVNFGPNNPGGFTSRLERVASVGAELSGAEVTAFYNAVNAYLAAL